MNRYLTLFILLIFVVSCCCVSAFASTKNVSVYMQSYSNGDVYGHTVVLEGESGVVSSTESITIGSNQAIFLSTYTLGYEDGSIFLWGNRSYDIVLENVSFNVSFPYAGNNFDFNFAERLSRDRIELRVTYVDGTTEVIQAMKYLSNLTDSSNQVNDVIYDIGTGSHTIYFSLSLNKDIRNVSIWEYMYLKSDLESAGVPAGTYSVPGIVGFKTPLKLSVSENEAYNQTLENINQNQQETNDKLDDVITEQESTNDKLDGFINGDPGVNNPTGSEDITDVTDAEQDLITDSSVGLEQGMQMQQNSLQILTQYRNAFLVVMNMVNMLYHIPFFNGLLSLSLAIGLVAVLMGLGFRDFDARVSHDAKTSTRSTALVVSNRAANSMSIKRS